MLGFARLSAAVPCCGVADFSKNRSNTLELWRLAHDEGSSLVVFPELGLCAYTVRDLLLDHHLLEACLASLGSLCRETRGLRPLGLLGLPLRVGSSLYNVAVAVQRGRPIGVVPKSYLPNFREFEEARWFSPGVAVPGGSEVDLLGYRVPFGNDVLFAAEDRPDLVVGVEICEDFWVQLPPHARQVSAGATVIANLSASNFVVGKAELRRLLARSASDRGKCAYVYAGAGAGESSTDLAFDADAFICENGQELASSRRFVRRNQLVTLDVDLELLMHERLVAGTFSDCAARSGAEFRRVHFAAGAEPELPLRRVVARHPFLPADPATLSQRCWEIYEVQAQALATRLEAVGSRRLVLGVSGGVDSTQAALVSAGALDALGLERANLICVSMPGFGTSKSTRINAERLARSLAATYREIDISDASRLLLGAVGHPAVAGVETSAELIARLRAEPGLGDVALENVQARLRTVVLMTLANQEHGLVVGTGDLSEKALGWATYGGDQISMYDVNAGLPKTLIRFVVDWVAKERVTTWSAGAPSLLRQTLAEILATPISPELLPADASGAIAQRTESEIGPYELHDFFLFHLTRHGARPRRILDLASIAFQGFYDISQLKHWLQVFLMRFFASQFKRSCTADAPKVGMVALSPRADWRMPSDACSVSWLQEVQRYPDYDPDEDV